MHNKLIIGLAEQNERTSRDAAAIIRRAREHSNRRPPIRSLVLNVTAR
jgi:hypothetical protein